MTRPGTRTALASAAVLAVLAVAGCASSDDQGEDPGTSSSPSGSPTSPAATPTGSASTPASETGTPSSGTGVSIAVTFEGDTVSPNGERVEVPVGEDVTLNVTADKAGEIHVHSTPEQELEYAAGTSSVTIKDLDQPGVVEVESHALDKVIVQLQVQ